VITFTHVGVELGSGTILRDVSLQIKPGEFVLLTGRTGSGKSTLLRLIYMDLIPTRGTVAVGDIHSARISAKKKALLRRSLGIVFQDYRMMDDRPVYDNVAFALEVTGVQRSEIKKRVMRVLGEVGLSHQRYRLPLELSGGERQRVIIARALVNGPTYLLADEPTGSLDPSTSKDIMDLLSAINVRGTGVIMATHNYDLVVPRSVRVLHIEDGQIREESRSAGS
jgi:cell division transport system ATP-binding protein